MQKDKADVAGLPGARARQFKEALLSWLYFGVFTLLVAAPQLPIYFSKAFGGRKVQHPDGRLTGFIRFVPIWQDQVRL